jgi:ADP-dependent NAD(P)H-hydrate dehydratase / NAD(P)H-hydrate epimerase
MRRMNGCEILTPAEMAWADKLAVENGFTGTWLMENAGHAVKSAVLASYPQICRAAVLCGPGNNGGDGYVVARLLAALGIKVVVHRDRSPKAGSDAARAAARWTGTVAGLDSLDMQPGDIIIDALYGAGFDGKLGGKDADVVDAANRAGLPIVSIDLPSGVSGLSGQVAGVAIGANRTVTFFRKKPGHVLYPGRMLCGVLEVADIGIGESVLSEIAPRLWENGPQLFGPNLPRADPVAHKYARGHVGVFSGGANSTGAARLSALAAARAGAGAVTIFSPSDALAVHAAHLTSVMLKAVDTADNVDSILQDKRLTCFVIGPAFGRFDWLREVVGLVARCDNSRSLVLDADVFSAFAPRPTDLFASLASSDCAAVMTPHQGEFERMFPDIAQSSVSKVEMARLAAKRASAVVVYKGPDTVIAAPEGRAAINTNGGPELATAGSGDVLAGMIAGLLAQGMPAFEAACAGAWMHGEAGERTGPRMMAEDLVSLGACYTFPVEQLKERGPDDAGDNACRSRH